VIVDPGAAILEFVDPSLIKVGDRVRSVFPRITGEPRLVRWVLE
jgi:hypothetical protein